MAKIATRQASGEALTELASTNPNVVVLDADLSKSTMTAEFKKVAPERFINVGIAEQNLIGTAAGLSLVGKIPFASSFAMFAAGRAFEESKKITDKPVAIFAKTVKGKGVSFMEDTAGWHGTDTRDEELNIALNEIGGNE